MQSAGRADMAQVWMGPDRVVTVITPQGAIIGHGELGNVGLHLLFRTTKGELRVQSRGR